LDKELFKVKRKAIRDLERLPKDYRLKVLEVLDRLRTDPILFRSYDLKKLKGLEDTFRIRLGNLGIVYTIVWSSRAIIVHFIGPREHAYK